MSVTKGKILSHKKNNKFNYCESLLYIRCWKKYSSTCGQNYGERKDVITLTCDDRTF